MSDIEFYASLWADIDLQSHRFPGAVTSQVSTEEIKEAVLGYLEAALWSSVTADGQPLDRTYRLADFSRESVSEAISDVVEFLWMALLEDGSARSLESVRTHSDFGNIGHDLLLTRNGEGTGFWAKPDVYGDGADELSELAQDMEPAYVVPEDGKLTIH
jgi:hypothetical protein